ncbi:MAG: hypothetical protein ACLQT6_08910 [Desulfomonilaceae bacterium]
MSLIKCPECNKDVSTQAASCPHCGAPISPPQEIKVVTELTGKRYKTLIFFSLATCIVGFFFAITGYPEFGVYMIVIGFIGYSYAKYLIWWEHK